MCDAFNNANDKIVNTVCNGNAITNDLTGKIVCDVPANRNIFLGATMWDVYMNGNDWVSMPRQIAHECILPQPVCQEGLSPTVSGSCGKDPPIAHTHLATVPNIVAERGYKPFV